MQKTLSKIPNADRPVRSVSLAPTYFAQVYSRAVEVIGNSDKAMRWLGRPIPALSYATPVSLLRNEKGRDAVLDVLGRLEHAVF
jgi:putative toxin-antitoxin system antitoxin component (TIGR02293 family)